MLYGYFCSFNVISVYHSFVRKCDLSLNSSQVAVSCITIFSLNKRNIKSATVMECSGHQFQNRFSHIPVVTQFIPFCGSNKIYQREFTEYPEKAA